MHVVCPGCSETREVSVDTHVGDIVSCDACAGALFRLVQDNGAYRLRELPQASCPECGTMLQLPDAVQAGAMFDHCGKAFVVTYTYGAYALESPAGT